MALVLLAVRPQRDAQPRSPARLDAIGIALLTALLVVVTLLINGTASAVGGVGPAVALVGLAALAGLLVVSQRRTSTPVAEWALFRSTSFAAATGYILLTNLAMYTTLLAVPFFITEFQGRSASTTGLLLGAMSVSMAVVAPTTGAVADRVGRRRPAVFGALAALGGGAALLAGISADSSFAFLAVCLAVVGLGIGVGTGPATTAAIESAPTDVAAGAAGTNSMMRYAGSILGAGALAGVLDRESGGAPEIETFRLVLAVVTVMAALAVLAATRIHRFPESHAEDASQPDGLRDRSRATQSAGR